MSYEILHKRLTSQAQKQNGKILDVGLDSAYNLTKDHKLISEEEVMFYMNNQNITTNDGHVIRKEQQ